MAKICEFAKSEADELRMLLDAAQSALGTLSQFAADLAADWETAFNEKSERWKETDAGKAASNRYDELTAWLDELPDADSLTEPPRMPA